jgi:hypothetical protein
MTFPVDILSYVLGLFSTRTTAKKHNLVPTALGVALFAFLPTFSLLGPLGPSALLGACALVFLGYMLWVFGKEADSSVAGHSTAAGARA